MAPGGFYAVARGWQPGIYRTWSKAEDQVKGFSGAKFKKFSTEQEARRYIVQHFTAPNTQLLSPPPQARASGTDDSDDSVKELEDKTGLLSISPAQREVQLLPDPGFIVFCSGSALENGSADGPSAFAYVFPNQQGWGAVGSLDGASKSNRAVYCAALGAIQRVNKHDPSRDQALTICTNSQDLIKSTTEWIVKWLTNGWLTRDNEPVKNQDVLKDILREQGHRRIEWVYTEAHSTTRAWESMWIDHAYRNARALADAACEAKLRMYKESRATNSSKPSA